MGILQKRQLIQPMGCLNAGTIGAMVTVRSRFSAIQVRIINDYCNLPWAL